MCWVKGTVQNGDWLKGDCPCFGTVPEKKSVGCACPISVIFVFLFLLYGCSQPAPDIQSAEEITLTDGNQYCGPIALNIICRLYDIPASVEELAQLAGMDSTGTTLYGLAQAGRTKGFEAIGLKVDFQYLQQLPMPLIAHVGGDHYVVVTMADKSGVVIIDPAKQSGEEYMAAEEFAKIWEGVVLQLTPQP